MRFLLKVLAAPIVAALTVFVWLCVGVLYCVTMVTGLAGWVIGFLGVAVLLTYSVQNGVILLVIAFLLSPLGPGPAVLHPGQRVLKSKGWWELQALTSFSMS